MKKSGVYLWLFVIAQGLVALVAINAASKRPRATEARLKRTRADVYGGLKTTLDMFKEDCGRYPTTAEGGLKALIVRPADISPERWRGPYFDPPEIPKDSWGHEYAYRCPAIYSTNRYDLYSLGSDGVSKSGGNDPDDIGNWEKSVSASSAAIEYEEMSSYQPFHFLLLFSPFLYVVRLIAGVSSQRVRNLMSENPRADTVWLVMSLMTILVWLSTLVQL